MDGQQIQQLNDTLKELGGKFDTFRQDFSDRLTKIETMFTMFEKSQNNLSEKMDEVERTAHDAYTSTRSAHKRLDNLETEIDRRFTVVNKDIGEVNDAIMELTKTINNQSKNIATLTKGSENDGKRLDKLEKIVYWAGTSVITILIGIIGFLYQTNGGN